MGIPLNKIRLEAYTERSESNPGRSLGIYEDAKKAVWKTVYLIDLFLFGTVFQTAVNHFFIHPETTSQVTLASLGIVFQTKLRQRDFSLFAFHFSPFPFPFSINKRT